MQAGSMPIVSRNSWSRTAAQASDPFSSEITFMLVGLEKESNIEEKETENDAFIRIGAGGLFSIGGDV